MDEQLRLDNIREVLIRQEETIIFSLIERALYHQNLKVYQPGALDLNGFDGSYCDYFLYETEAHHARFRRYTTPEEHPFFENLPQPVIQGAPANAPIMANAININDQIKSVYIEQIIPLACPEGDDGQYGSSVVCDCQVLQALSKRIHYGKFVAESKYLSNPAVYRELAAQNDREGIWRELTNQAVEDRLLQRVARKAETYGRDPMDTEAKPKISGHLVADIYRDWIIPLTKEVEVDYLILRGLAD